MNQRNREEVQGCGHMQSLLQRQAQGELKGIAKAYTRYHVATCPACRVAIEHMHEQIDANAPENTVSSTNG